MSRTVRVRAHISASARLLLARSASPVSRSAAPLRDCRGARARAGTQASLLGSRHRCRSPIALPIRPLQALPPPQRIVQVDGLVLLKIQAHAAAHAPDAVAGTLLGLELDGCLEVTHS